MPAAGRLASPSPCAPTPRAAATEALTGVTGIDTIQAASEDGATVITITVDSEADQRAIDDILTRCTLTYRITGR